MEKWKTYVFENGEIVNIEVSLRDIKGKILKIGDKVAWSRKTGHLEVGEVLGVYQDPTTGGLRVKPTNLDLQEVEDWDNLSEYAKMLYSEKASQKCNKVSLQANRYTGIVKNVIKL